MDTCYADIVIPGLCYRKALPVHIVRHPIVPGGKKMPAMQRRVCLMKKQETSHHLRLIDDGSFEYLQQTELLHHPA
jgi:hypothetical protein